MGCPSECYLGESLVFSITTHDPDTGVATAASAITWAIYEGDTVGDSEEIDAGTGIDTATGMTTVFGETGEYVKSVSITSPTYTAGNNYTIFIRATVDSDTGGIAYTFKARNSIRNANVVQIDSDTNAATKLKDGMSGVVTGQVTSQDNTTQLTVKTLSPNIKANDIIKNRVLTFTSGDAIGQSLLINDYSRTTDSSGVVTTSVMVGTIAANDEFTIA